MATVYATRVHYWLERTNFLAKKALDCTNLTSETTLLAALPLDLRIKAEFRYVTECSRENLDSECYNMQC
jgi:hypothetical protein